MSRVSRALSQLLHPCKARPTRIDIEARAWPDGVLAMLSGSPTASRENFMRAGRRCPGSGTGGRPARVRASSWPVEQHATNTHARAAGRDGRRISWPCALAHRTTSRPSRREANEKTRDETPTRSTRVDQRVAVFLRPVEPLAHARAPPTTLPRQSRPAARAQSSTCIGHARPSPTRRHPPSTAPVRLVRTFLIPGWSGLLARRVQKRARNS